MKRLVVIAISIFIAACTGKTGPAGATGGNGTDGINGMNGSNGSNGNDIILSVRAKLGLDIAAQNGIMLNLTGLDGPGIEAVGIGSYYVNAVAPCSACHDSPQQQYLAGGVQFPVGAPGAGQFVYTRNLTPDPTTGLPAHGVDTEAKFVEVFQTGRDFHPDQNSGNGQLLVMPWSNFRWLHTDDIKAIYAYLKAIPAVMNQVTADNKPTATPIPLPTTYDRGEQSRPITSETNYLGQPVPDPDGVIRGAEVNPLDDPANYGAMDATTQAAFGRGAYIITMAICNDCHTNGYFNAANTPNLTPGVPYSVVPNATYLSVDPTRFLMGGAVFVTPTGLEAIFHQQRSMSHNLLGSVNGFFNESASTFARFQAILATGTHVDDPGTPPLAWPMPWDHFRNMTTDDLTALYTYLWNSAHYRGDATGAVCSGTAPCVTAGQVCSIQPGATTGHCAAEADKVTQGAAVWCDATHACPGIYTTCKMQQTPGLNNVVVGNECIGNTCTTDADCGACQHCTGTGTKTCAAPDPNNAADVGCVTVGLN